MSKRKHRTLKLTMPDMTWTMEVYNFISDTINKVKRLKVKAPYAPPDMKNVDLLATLRIYHNKKTGEIYFRIGNHSSRTSGTWMFVEDAEDKKTEGDDERFTSLLDGDDGSTDIIDRR